MNKRQKKKQIQTKNRKLVERYPFLLPRNRWTDKAPSDYNYEYTELDEMPEMWKKVFGKEMLEEIREELIKHNFLDKYRIMQIKEKYGFLHWYDAGYPRDSKIPDIINKYEVISKHVCFYCGKLDVPVINDYGWYLPVCEKCYDKNNEWRIEENKKRGKEFYKTIPYEDQFDKTEDYTTPNSYTVSTYENGKSMKRTVDISGTVERLRKKFNK